MAFRISPSTYDSSENSKLSEGHISQFTSERSRSKLPPSTCKIWSTQKLSTSMMRPSMTSSNKIKHWGWKLEKSNKKGPNSRQQRNQSSKKKEGYCSRKNRRSCGSMRPKNSLKGPAKTRSCWSCMSRNAENASLLESSQQLAELVVEKGYNWDQQSDGQLGKPQHVPSFDRNSVISIFLLGLSIWQLEDW